MNTQLILMRYGTWTGFPVSVQAHLEMEPPRIRKVTVEIDVGCLSFVQFPMRADPQPLSLRKELGRLIHMGPCRILENGFMKSIGEADRNLVMLEMLDTSLLNVVFPDDEWMWSQQLCKVRT